MKIFSIIIPTFNCEKFIGRAIDSVINQKNMELNNFEIIIIDDFSQDNTSIICEEYMNRYKGIVRYFKNKNNMGVAFSRNFGIQNASGKFIMFLDSDDYYDEKLLFNLKLIIDNYENCKAILFGYTVTDGKNVQYVENYENINEDNIFEMFLQDKVKGYCWSWCFNRDIIKYEFDSSLIILEDFLFLYQNFKYFESVKILHNSMYYYYQNNESVVHSSTNVDKKITSVIYLFNHILNNESKNTEKYLYNRFCDILFKLSFVMFRVYPYKFNDLLYNDKYISIIQKYRGYNFGLIVFKFLLKTNIGKKSIKVIFSFLKICKRVRE